MSNQATINDVKLTLQQHIFDARDALSATQEKQATALKRIIDLEGEIASFKNWEAEKQRYKLETLPPGIHMYGLKPGMENGEPPHKICATCFNQGFKSLLHITGQGNGLTSWKCHRCGFEEQTGHFVDPRPDRDYNPFI
ncbi:MAG: hypothetical protein HY834_11295 [Devosia nanyangense]|uniref:Uncharacterized protein n=1 Tax=Devosia nanyangense TaxID=1228055 RepID=A0A933NYS6_9HYPH|nr:hypothetical protein [Devosia nanyangense]